MAFDEAQSKVLVVRIRAFASSIYMDVSVRPSAPGIYKIVSVSYDTIRLQLKPRNSWLPSFITLTPSDRKIPLQAIRLNTGGDGVTVGMMVMDRLGVGCDDSCQFAFDGVCDDPYDDYYKVEKHLISACLAGTDCTDCGGVDAVVVILPSPEVFCTDGMCDCQDCGKVGNNNFTGDVDISSHEFSIDRNILRVQMDGTEQYRQQWTGAGATFLALVAGLFLGRRLRKGRSSSTNGSNTSAATPGVDSWMREVITFSSQENKSALD